MNEIKVSIITPLYKGMDYVPGLMAMIRKNAELLPDAQKGKNVPKAKLEFILVNDSPADGLLKEEELIRNYVPDQAFELTAVNHTENQGIHAARLTGLSKAQGEYILFLDQDDAISDSAVRTLLFTPEHILEKQIPIYAKKAVLKEVGHEKMYLYGTDMIFSPGQCLIRKAVIPRDWCKRRLTVNGCDDFLLWLLMFHEKRSFCAIEDKIYIHNDTVNSYSSSYEAMERSFYAVCEFLEQTEGYDKKKIQILRRRYALKSKLKQNGSKRQKISVVLMNLDILYYTLKYKIKGYY